MDEGTQNDMRESGIAAYHRVPSRTFAYRPSILLMRGHHPPARASTQDQSWVNSDGHSAPSADIVARGVWGRW